MSISPKPGKKRFELIGRNPRFAHFLSVFAFATSFSFPLSARESTFLLRAADSNVFYLASFVSSFFSCRLLGRYWRKLQTNRFGWCLRVVSIYFAWLCELINIFLELWLMLHRGVSGLCRYPAWREVLRDKISEAGRAFLLIFTEELPSIFLINDGGCDELSFLFWRWYF